MIQGIVLLGIGLLFSFELIWSGVEDDHTKQLKVPLQFAVIAIIVGIAGGTFFVTRALIAHHLTSN